jgi:Fic family protein
MIEGNRLAPQEVEQVLQHEGHFSGRERDEHEVKGYYAALATVEQWAAKGAKVTEKMVQELHALVMGGGKIRVKPTRYRDGQNVIRDALTKRIVYMPPEAKDVPELMAGLIDWIRQNQEIPAPIVASITHYQFATIHPYYDGNGRTARLLTTLILHLGGYDLKGLYSLEEYYARNLGAYYTAISVGPSHNYYMGRTEADISQWIEYFIGGLTDSFEKTFERMLQQENVPDQSDILRKLDAKQRKVLELFKESETITSKQVGQLFGFKARYCSLLCKTWVESGFLEIVDFSNKNRQYNLSKSFRPLISRF